jgi:hypothetical protein
VSQVIAGLMAFAGLLGTIFGNQAIRVGAFVVVIVFIASVILLLLADRRNLQRSKETTWELLTRYCDFIRENNPEPLISVKTWDQVVYVEPTGTYEKSSRSPRSRCANGSTSPGPRWIVTTSWTSEQKLTAVLHLHEPIKQGEEIHFEVVRTWPAKCRPLMRDEVADSFIFRTDSRLLAIQRVEYKIVLPAGYDAVHEPIGLLEPDVHLTVDDERDQEGRKVFTWRADLVPSGKTVGATHLAGSLEARSGDDRS